MLNINFGHNKELMDKCRTLREYSQYVDRVRKYAKRMRIEEAVERAVTECTREGHSWQISFYRHRERR